jgi:site-specific recombinase XerD
MNFMNLQQHYHELLDYLQKEGYTKSYVRRIKENIHWILKNEKCKSWQSYQDIYGDRVHRSESKQYKRCHNTAFGVIQQFDLYRQYPNRKTVNCLIKHGAYYQLIPEFKALIDFYKVSDKFRELKDSTIDGNASGASSFLYAMQKRGKQSLSDITEDDALSFFLDSENNVSKCSSYKKQIAAVFKIGISWKEKECRILLAYLPQIRPKRKNIQFLTSEEVDAIHTLLNDNNNSELSLRDRAIGKLLFFTGMRACDIAEMKLTSIDWKAEKIHFLQQKTNQQIDLPLIATIGNSIYDYLMNERPESSDDHLFLGELYPHYPFGAGAVWHQAAKIYKAASIRQEEGDRRGTHLFRHNVATSFLGNGVPRPVITQTLGHIDPLSLEPYLHADILHLRECALSIERFPVSEEVFSR